MKLTKRVWIPVLAAALTVPPVGWSATAFQKACGQDVKKHCEGVKAGHSRQTKCLREHEGDLSETCKHLVRPAPASHAKAHEVGKSGHSTK
jgi:hypothetical protein